MVSDTYTPKKYRALSIFIRMERFLFCTIRKKGYGVLGSLAPTRDQWEEGAQKIRGPPKEPPDVRVLCRCLEHAATEAAAKAAHAAAEAAHAATELLT